MSHGWGETKAGLVRNAVTFDTNGYVVLAFDYRGWGDSDGKLVVIGEMAGARGQRQRCGHGAGSPPHRRPDRPNA